MMNQLSLSVAHSGRMLFSFISCFILSIHLSLGLPLGRDPGTWVARTYFAILCSSLLWTWPNQDNRFFVRKVFIGCTWAFSRMVVFIIWSFLVFPCIHLNIFISVVFIRLWSLFRIGQSRKSLATLMGVMCSTSQCELRSTFPNLRVNERNSHCDVLHIAPVRVANLVLDDAIAAIQTSRSRPISTIRSRLWMCYVDDQ